MAHKSSDIRSGSKTGKSRSEQMFSDLPPEADLTADIVDVSQAPIADSCSAIKAQWIDNLLNHLVGALLELHRHVEAERLGGLHVNNQLQFRNLLYR
jgi:hypothetical protein